MSDRRADVSSARRRSFFGIIGVLVVAFVVFLGEGLSMLVIGWLPDGTLATMLDPSAPLHRFHALGIGWLFAIPVIGVLVQLRRPESKAAPMQQAVLAAAVIDVVAIVCGTLSIDGIVFFALISAVALLHPLSRQIARLGSADRVMFALSGVAAVPWAVYAAHAIGLQRLDTPGDIHAEYGHWALMASLAVVIVGVAFVGAGDRSGWRISAWTAGLISILAGVASLLHPHIASALSGGWAATAIIWSIAYLVAAESRLRREGVGSGNTPTPQVGLSARPS